MRSLPRTLLVAAFLPFVAAFVNVDASCPRPDAQVPIRSLEFHVDPEARSSFFDQIEVIANRFGLEYRAAQVTPDAVFWIAEMADTDFRIIVENSLKPEQYHLRAYENCTKPVPHGRLERFLSEVQAAIVEVPGITIRGPNDAVPISKDRVTCLAI